jgi:prolyl-tRNA editing enzyme YbaK/EbsC (Cys-tRNA(Pro) deacylase)
MDQIYNVQKYLDKFNLGLKVIVPEEYTGTVETAAAVLGVRPGQIAKSILLKAGEEYVMVVAAGDVKIKDGKLKRLLGKKPKLASPEEVKEVTGYPVGGVCPFLLKTPVKILLDSSLRRFDVVYAAAGTANSALPINMEQLKIVTGGVEADVSQLKNAHID